LEARESELQEKLHVNELEAREQLSELQEFNVDNNTLDLEIKQEKAIFTNDVFIPPLNM
jgi:hypothetical protein